MLPISKVPSFKSTRFGKLVSNWAQIAGCLFVALMHPSISRTLGPARVPDVVLNPRFLYGKKRPMPYLLLIDLKAPKLNFVAKPPEFFFPLQAKHA